MYKRQVLPRDIGKDRPCLYYQIGQCSAPCAGKISQEEYSEMFNKISDVLSGNYSMLEKALTEKMYKASDNLEYEKAAGYRDRINNLRALDEKQKIISTNEDNRDIIGVYRENNDCLLYTSKYCLWSAYTGTGCKQLVEFGRSPSKYA